MYLCIYHVDKKRRKQKYFLRVGNNKNVQNAKVPALLAPPQSFASFAKCKCASLLHSQVAPHTTHNILKPFAYRATFTQLRLQCTIG